jgi:hypothetical protein
LSVAKGTARELRGQASRVQEDTRLDGILPLIQRAKDAGATLGKIAEELFGDPKPSPKLKARLKALASEGVIRGPFKYASPPKKTKDEYYFSVESCPSAKTVGAKVACIAQQAGSKPPSEKALKEKVTGIDALFLKDAIKDAVDTRAVMELTCDSKKFYVHRDAAAKHFDEFDDTDLTFEEFLVAYRRLKAEQRGLSTVNISDLLKVLEVPRRVLHQLLLRESKAKRVSIHPTTVDQPREVIDDGIRLPNFAEPFVTVVVKGEP